MPLLRKRRDSHRRWYQLSRAILLLAVLLAPLGYGGNNATWNTFLTGLLLLGAVSVGVRAGKLGRISSPVLLLTLLGLLLSLIQLIPLPIAWIQSVFPGTYQLLPVLWTPVLTHHPIGLDVPGSHHEIVKMIGYFSAAWLVGHTFQGVKWRGYLWRAIAISGVIVVAIGFVHPLLGVTKIYGLVTVKDAFIVTPFVNANHAAAFLGVTSLVAMGLVLNEESRMRFAYGAMVLATGAGLLLTFSRGGIIAYVMSMIFLFASRQLQHQTPRGWRENAVPFLALFLGMTAVAGFLTANAILEELSTLASVESGLGKFSTWGPTLTMMGEFPILGIGRGSFESVYPYYRATAEQMSWTHVENEWLQTLLDYGIPGGLSILGLASFCFYKAVGSHGGSPLKLAGIAALFFLGLHNLVDFNLMQSSISLLAVVILTLVYPRKTRERSDKRGGFLGSLVVCCVLIGLLGWSSVQSVGRSLKQDTNRLAQVLKEPKQSWSQKETASLEIVSRHPADYFLPLMVANYTVNHVAEAGATLRWTNRAMYLNPQAYRPHAYAAYTLWKMGAKAQALTEFKLSAKLYPPATFRFARFIISKGGTLEDLSGLASVGGMVQVEVARYLFETKHERAALELLQEETILQVAKAGHVKLNILLALNEFQKAHTLALRLVSMHSQNEIFYSLGADAAAKAGNLPGALKLLRDGLSYANDKWLLINRRVMVLLEAGRFSEAEKSSELLLVYANSKAEQARSHWLVGMCHEKQGRRMKALKEYEIASRYAAQQPKYKVAMASIYYEIGEYQQAFKVIETVRNSINDRPHWSALYRKIREHTETAAQ